MVGLSVLPVFTSWCFSERGHYGSGWAHRKVHTKDRVWLCVHTATYDRSWIKELEFGVSLKPVHHIRVRNNELLESHTFKRANLMLCQQIPWTEGQLQGDKLMVSDIKVLAAQDKKKHHCGETVLQTDAGVLTPRGQAFENGQPSVSDQEHRSSVSEAREAQNVCQNASNLENAAPIPQHNDSCAAESQGDVLSCVETRKQQSERTFRRWAAQEQESHDLALSNSAR